MTASPIENRLLSLTDELIGRGVPPAEAATAAAKVLTSAKPAGAKPWFSVEEAAEQLGVSYSAVNLALRAGSKEFKGAKKICGRWLIPAAIVTPQLSENA